GEFAELELVRAKELVVGGAEQRVGEFVDLGGGGLADGLSQGLDFGGGLRGTRGRRHETASLAKVGFLPTHPRLPFFSKNPPTFKTPTVVGTPEEFFFASLSAEADTRC